MTDASDELSALEAVYQQTQRWLRAGCFEALGQTQGPKAMTQDHFTYRVTWSPEDGEHVGLCAEFPSLSWLDATPEGALAGIRKAVAQVVRDMEASGEKVADLRR